jgi:hypothetical protein
VQRRFPDCSEAKEKKLNENTILAPFFSSSSSEEFSNQGDQIGRIFVYWAVVDILWARY